MRDDQIDCVAAFILVGVNGTERSRTPIASKTALEIAAEQTLYYRLRFIRFGKPINDLTRCAHTCAPDRSKA